MKPQFDELKNQFKHFKMSLNDANRNYTRIFSKFLMQRLMLQKKPEESRERIAQELANAIDTL